MNKDTRYYLRMTKEEKERFSRLAQEAGVTLSKWMREALYFSAACQEKSK